MAYVDLKQMAFEAFTHIQKNEFKQAYEKLSFLLNIHPNDAILIYYVGCMFLAQKQYGLAIMALERALTLDSTFDQCFNNIATAYRQVGDIDKCIQYFSKAVTLAEAPGYRDKFEEKIDADKNLCDYLGNLGSCYVGKGTPLKALKYLNQALEIFPNNDNVLWNQGLAYLEMGDYEKGFIGYDKGERVSSNKERSYHGSAGSTPLWPGPSSDATNKPTVVVYGEQGIGDEIMFASILPDMMKDANIIFECHPRLMEIFRASFPDINIYGTRKATTVEWAKNHKIDFKIAIGSLAKFYRKKKEDFTATPYLFANPKLIEKMQERCKTLDNNGCKPKIGISWKGGIGITNKTPRCIPMELLKPLMSFDVDFISLQYHTNAQHEVDTFNEQMGATVIHHWQDVVDDYDLTTALLPNLSMIISVAQSVVHLAGAMGITTIQMCPKQALWQMGSYGQNAPWYDSVQNFWQLIDGNWETVIANIVNLMEHEGYKCL